jgi:tripartite ATP-independent transporter DctM subunit
MSVSVGDLFKGAVLPGMLLVGLYISYILIYAFIKKDAAPAIVSEKQDVLTTLNSILPPLLLIFIVLGSIFAGIASPTESAAFGVVGAVLLSVYKKSFSLEMMKYSSMTTIKLSGMIFMILIGATAFSLVFNELGGSDIILEFFSEDIADPWVFIAFAMIIIFVLGFFIDFIEISFIVVPIMVPILEELGIDPIWFAILVAMNLQASFITPPFGLSLFFLKGAAKDMLTTIQIYKGIIPFIFLQLLALSFVMFFPNLVFAFL